MAPRIYTRSGDSGETGLFDGERVNKDDLRVEAYGSTDELNSVLGLSRAHCSDPDLTQLIDIVQHDLFCVGADLATPEISGTSAKRAIARVTPRYAARLEKEIDRLQEELPPLSQFILPGGSPLAGFLHLARTVCRRAERRCSSLAGVQTINPEIMRYLNRLSDLLFVMARIANHREGIQDVPWHP
jgi:cob(I)alamin adenosyltransferase